MQSQHKEVLVARNKVVGVAMDCSRKDTIVIGIPDDSLGGKIDDDRGKAPDTLTKGRNLQIVISESSALPTGPKENGRDFLEDEVRDEKFEGPVSSLFENIESDAASGRVEEGADQHRRIDKHPNHACGFGGGTPSPTQRFPLLSRCRTLR